MPILDDQNSRASCGWTASLEAPPEDLQPAKRPDWWRHGMSLFGERSAPLDAAEAIEALEPVKPKRAYHQPSRELRNWVVDCALHFLQGWDNKTVKDHLTVWLPHVFQPWMSTRTLPTMAG